MTEKTGQFAHQELSLPSCPIPVITSSHTGGVALDCAATGVKPPPFTSIDANEVSGRKPIRTPPSLTSLHQILLFLLVVLLCSGFLLARMLEPSPQGFGTHQQLGFPPCSIQYLFGVPCPSCGMTTSFAWFVRGQFVSAWRANPAGCYLATICSLLIPWSLLSIWTKSTWKIQRTELVAIGLTSGFLVLACLQWGVRYLFASW